ncbi:MAG: hypothetical protein M1823_005529 [Watsoniomyces obsoletus]|nr:MAG: hypothetical protein M1823_005529 [Watsoniomyces obsoletus]
MQSITPRLSSAEQKSSSAEGSKVVLLDQRIMSYDLFVHNCNNFTNDFATFLVGKGIPDRITSLPQTVLSTPFGQMLKPQLDSAMRSMTQAPLPPSSAPAAGVARRALYPANGYHSSDQKQASGQVRNVKSLPELQALLDAAKMKCAVVFFTMAGCGPCRIMYPTYDELAAEAGNCAIFIKVDIREAQDVAMKYGVRATPTFMTFFHGEKENEWKGADDRKLRGNVGLLIQMAQHPHMRLHLPTMLGTSKRPLTYTKMPPLDKLMAKMGPLGQDPSAQAVKEFVQTRNREGSREATLPDLHAFSDFVRKATVELAEELMFTVVDLIRIAVVDPRVSGYFAEEGEQGLLKTILEYVTATSRPYSLRLVTLQMLCNMFTTPLFAARILKNASLVTAIWELEADMTHENVQVSAASLVFNIALSVHTSRLEGEGTTLSEEDQMLLLIALDDGITTDKQSVDAFKRNLLALGFLVYCAPQGGEVLNYVKEADVGKHVREKSKIFPQEEKLIGEIGRELLAKV